MAIRVSEEPATSTSVFTLEAVGVSIPWVPTSKRHKVRFQQLNLNIRLHEDVRSYMLTFERVLMFTCLLEFGVLCKGLRPLAPGFGRVCVMADVAI
jgi:hypothetical protein